MRYIIMFVTVLVLSVAMSMAYAGSGFFVKPQPAAPKPAEPALSEIVKAVKTCSTLPTKFYRDCYLGATGNKYVVYFIEDLERWGAL